MDAFNFIDSWGAIKQRNDLIILILAFSLFLSFFLFVILSIDLVDSCPFTRSHLVACQQSMCCISFGWVLLLVLSWFRSSTNIHLVYMHTVCAVSVIHSHSYSHVSPGILFPFPLLFAPFASFFFSLPCSLSLSHFFFLLHLSFSHIEHYYFP